MNGERELHLLIEPAENRHEAVDGEAAEIDISDTLQVSVSRAALSLHPQPDP
jgi:hypothetical protein